MNWEVFDWEALIQALVLATGIGFLVTATAYFFKRRPKGVLIMLSAGVILIVVAALLCLSPTLIKVPDISNLSRAESEYILFKKRLVPQATPQYNQETEPGRVIPHSQDPRPGIKVPRGTTVTYAVSTGTWPSESSGEKNVGKKVFVSLFRPRSHEQVHCIRYADGIYRFSVVGTASGLLDKSRLLLWLRPVKPASEIPGWYLQRPPVNGIGEVKKDGSWQGIAQIGNVQWPPHARDVFDVAATIVDHETANRLIAEQGVVTRIDLPGIASDIALAVMLDL